MIHESGDSDFWLKIASYVSALNLRRLHRFALECVINSRIVGANDYLESKMALGIDDIAGLWGLRKILEDLGDNNTLNLPIFDFIRGKKYNESVTRYIENYSNTPVWLQSLVREEIQLSRALNEDHQEPLEIELDSLDWTTLGENLIELAEDTSDGDDLNSQIVLLIKIPEAQEPEASSEKVSSSENRQESVPEDDTTIEAGSDDRANSRRRKRRSFGEELIGARSSKRVRARVEEQAVQESTEDNEFFDQIDKIFAPFNFKFGNIAKLILVDSDDDNISEDFREQDQPLRDLLSSLQEWKDSNGNLLLKGEGISNPSANVSRMVDMAMVKSVTKHSNNLPDSKGLQSFISLINNSLLTIDDSCLQFLLKLLLPQEDNVDLFLKYKFPESLIGVIEDMLPLYLDALYQHIVFTVKNDGQDAIVRYLKLTESIYELLLNIYIDEIQSSVGSNQKAQQKIAVKADQLERWREFLMDISCLVEDSSEQHIGDLRLRYEWTTIIHKKAIGTSHEELLELFNGFMELLLEYPNHIIYLPNTAYIPEISSQGVSMQMSKLHASSVFSDICQNLDQDAQKNVQMLEAILQRSDSRDISVDVDFEIMEQFIRNASLEFRLFLWSLLRKGYAELNESNKAFECLPISLSLVMKDLSSEEYLKLGQSQRIFTLYRSLYLLQDTLLTTSEYCLKDSQYLATLSDSKLNEVVSYLFTLLRLLHVCMVHEDNLVNNNITVKETKVYNKSVNKMHEMLVQSWCIVYVCYSTRLISTLSDSERAEKCLQLLYVLHEELGTRACCSLSDGAFLKLLQSELIRIDSPESENEMLQCLHCRFGLALGNELFFPYDHKTTPGSLDRPNALELVQFIMAMALRKRNSQTLPRSDMKVALDKFCEVIGVPRRDQTSIYYNQSVLESFLNQSLDPLILKRSIRGEECLSTIKVKSDYAKVAMIGLYFLQGQVYLTQYRSRKRTMAGRTEDLDYAIRYFKHDLVCNTNRFESWYGLAQTYDAQAEDDMTWSAEKLNSEYRKSIGATQRRAILCYSVATSLYLRQDTIIPPKSILATFWTDFGYELYSSARAPMEMEAFHVEEFERHFSGSTGMYSKPRHPELKSTTAIKLSLHMFHMAKCVDRGGWKNHYMEGKCLGKLGADALEVLDCYVRSISCVPEKSSQGDPIFEPHYKLISSVFKYFMKGSITLEVALEYLPKTSYYKESEQPIISKKQLFELLIEMLNRLRSADKKHWHHRPTYRIATILERGLDEVEKAREEIAGFFALRAAKSYLTIWRPEFERAGRHFVYAYSYTCYYVDLLEKTNDITTLNVIAKKLRRLTTVTIRHTELWEHICKAILSTLRNLSEVPERYMETSLASMPVDDFFNRASQLEQICMSLRPPPTLVKYLHETSELRRLNAALAPTAGMEDVFGSIYVKLFYQLPQLEEEYAKQKAELREFDESKASLAGDISAKKETESEPNESSMNSRVTATESAANTPSSFAGTEASTPVPPVKARTARVTRKEVLSKANALLKPFIAAEAKEKAIAAKDKSVVKPDKPTATASSVDGEDLKEGNEQNEKTATKTSDSSKPSQEAGTRVDEDDRESTSKNTEEND
ncbi:hypothetical protein V1511DRAFT_491878 [Dipodascopsis uninucleata]